MVMLFVPFLVAVISLSMIFLIESPKPRIDATTLSSMPANRLPLSFLDKYSLSTSSLGCEDLYIVINVVVILFIY